MMPIKCFLFIFLFSILCNKSHAQTHGLLEQIIPCTLDELPPGTTLVTTYEQNSKEEFDHRIFSRLHNSYEEPFKDKYGNPDQTWLEIKNLTDKHYWQFKLFFLKNNLMTCDGSINNPNTTCVYTENFYQKLINLKYDSETFNKTEAEYVNVNGEFKLKPSFEKLQEADFYRIINYYKTPNIKVNTLDLGENFKKLEISRSINLYNLNRYAQTCGGLQGAENRYLSQIPNNSYHFLAPQGTHEKTIFEMQGLVTRTGNNIVSGSAQFFIYQLKKDDTVPNQYSKPFYGYSKGFNDPPNSEFLKGDAVQLIIEKYNFDKKNWEKIANNNQRASYGEVYMQIDTNVPKGTVVRMRLVTNLSYSGYGDYALGISLKNAKFFGSQCYPNFAKPGECL